MSVYRTIKGERWLVDDWRRAQVDALRALCREIERPAAPAELADALGVSPDDVTHMALVSNGHALLRRIPGTSEKGLWPREELTPRLLEALSEFRRLPLGTVIEWKEPRRQRDRKFKARRMTMSRTLRSRIRTGLRAARDFVGLRSLRDVRPEHLRLLPEAVWTLQMEASPVPRDQWRSRDEAARRARKTADNRRSEIAQFLSWAEWRGHLSLHLAVSGTLPEPWTEFVLRASDLQDDQLDVIARRLAKIAYERLHVDSPERLVEVGFEAVEHAILEDTRYANEFSARTTISKLRRAWNACAGRRGHHPLPEWPAREPAGSTRRLGDGGLVHSWWSARAFFEGRPSLLDRAGMEVQRRQAKDLRDWWMIPDPTLRSEDEGGPLPRRPERSRQGMGRKRFGARSADEMTALKPLTVVSKLQRFAMSYDEQAHRLSPHVMERVDWENLFADRRRTRRFIEWIFSENRAQNGGKYITAGVRSAWYVYTLMWAYFPAWCEMQIARIREQKRVLDFRSDEGLREAQALERRRDALEEQIEECRHRAQEIKSLIENLTVEHGGIQPRKDRTEIRRHLNHGEFRRMVAHLRDLREERAERLLIKTARLIRRREVARAHPCEAVAGESVCGELQCERHHPLPEQAPSGIAWEVMDRTYCKLITQEAMLRLHSILPWRPSTLRRAVLGLHLDPDTLELAVVGQQGKVDRDARGEVKRQRVRLPDLPYWDDPAEVTETVGVVRLLLGEARVWLLAHPTKTGLRLRRDGDERRLLINHNGVAWRDASTYSASFRAAITFAARGVNSALADSEEPIHLPKGWGAKGSYVLRFLYGQRIRERGGSFEDIAAALGNSPATARKHYQDEQEGEALNRIAEKHRGRRAEPMEPPPEPKRPGPGAIGAPDAAHSEFEALIAAKAKFDAQADALGLDEDERECYWAQRKATIQAEWRT